MSLVRDIKRDLENEAIGLIRDYHAVLMDDARTYCGTDHQAAEDIVMRTIEAYLAKPEKDLPPQPATLSWLRTTLRNTYTKSVRGKARACTVYLDPSDLALVSDVMASDTSTDEAILAHSDAEIVRKAIDALPNEVRQIFVMRFFESMSVAQIARILRVSNDSVKGRIYYARKILAKRLRKSLGKGGLVAVCLAVLALVASAAIAIVGHVEDEAKVPQVPQPSQSSQTAQPSSPLSVDAQTPQETQTMMKLTRMLTTTSMAALTTLGLPGALPAETTIYVNGASSAPAEPYDTRQNASRTLAAAIAYANKLGAAALPAEIRVAPGTYPENSLWLTNAISVVGETGNPNDVIVSDNAGGNKRAFEINHAQAMIAGLTISGKGCDDRWPGGGGHLNLRAGMVENCIVKDGKVKDAGLGGNVFMTGGRMVRCQILNGTAYSTQWANSRYALGGGVYAKGGTLESCLISGNKAASGNDMGGGIVLADTATAVNCTIVGNTAAQTSRGGVYCAAGCSITSADAHAVNCVIYGNTVSGTDSVDTEIGSSAKNFPANYDHCASSVTNSSCATWWLIGGAAFNDADEGDYRPVLGSTLVDNGTTDENLVPESVLSPAAVDLRGEARLSGGSLDIGAYELDQSVTGNFVGDGGYVGMPAVFEAAAAQIGDVPVRYAWDFGDGNVLTTEQSSCSHVYARRGFYSVKVTASTDGGETWCRQKELDGRVQIVPQAVYVDPRCGNATFPFDTHATAANTIRQAMQALTNEFSKNEASFGRIVLVRGAKLPALADNLGFTIEHPVTIAGETANPADAEIVDASTASDRCAMTLNHQRARMENLTISGAGVNRRLASGGHVNLMRGTIENCVITGGKVLDEGRGGNVFMTGGRMSRCRILDGSLGSTTYANERYAVGGGVYATGGILENCLVANNTAPGGVDFGGGIVLAGTATAVNCTIVGNTAALTWNQTYHKNYAAGCTIVSDQAKAVGCVIYGNALLDGTVSVETEIGYAEGEMDNHFASYACCASSAENDMAQSWQVIGSDEHAFADYGLWREKAKIKGLSPARDGVLRNRGCNEAEYSGAGALSAKDLLGRARLVGKRIDIGALEAPNACSYILFR